MNIRKLLLVSLCLMPTVVFPYTMKVFYTGNDYLKISKDYPQIQGIERLYISGLNDALVMEYEWLRLCTLSKPQSQLGAIFHKYLQAHPGQWEQPASVLYVSAMKESCEKI